MKQSVLSAMLIAALALPVAPLAQGRRADPDRPRTGTAQPRSGSGDPDTVKPREPKEDGGSTRDTPRAGSERDERPGRVVGRPDPRRVVFVGGYFYDPYFGRAPWWAPELYPHIAVPVFQPLARIRITRAPRDASVYVDGFYAGVVDDFDGFFQGLPVLPGGHAITLYSPGYQTITRYIYLTPRATWKIEAPMAPLPQGVSSEPPMVAHMPPPPPVGTYLPPPRPPAGLPVPPPGASVPLGTLSLRVQPSSSHVAIDGLTWTSTAPGTLVVQLTPGRHRVDVESADRHAYSTEVEIEAFRTTELNISVPDAVR